MTQGRPKGNKAEIEVAKILEPWWATWEPTARDGKPIRFVRTPLSGGWGGPDIRGSFRAAGDLMTTAEKFPFAVEVKRREGWQWLPMLRGRRSPIWGYWRQAIAQAREMSCVPMLWFRKNREPWWVLLPNAVVLNGYPGKGIPTEYMDKKPVFWLRSEYAKGVDVEGVVPALLSAEQFLKVPPITWWQATRDFHLAAVD